MDIFKMLEADEGVRYSLYKDSLGYWTIGIGHLVTKKPGKADAIAVLDKELKRKTNGTLTKDEVRKLFNQDVEKAVAGIKKSAVLGPVYESLDPIRQTALVNMVFQMGQAGVEGFKNSMAYIKAKNWTKAESNLKLSKWYKQTPNRAKRVISVFVTGTYKAYSAWM